MDSRLSLLAARQVSLAAVTHKPLWLAGLLAGSLHAALLGSALHVAGSTRDPATHPTAMQMREVLAMPTKVFLSLQTPAPMQAEAFTSASPTEVRNTERVPPMRRESPGSLPPGSNPAVRPATLAETPDDGPGRTPLDSTPEATGLRNFIAAEHLDWQPMPFSAPDTRLLDGISASGLALKARLLINAQGVVEDLLPLQPVLPQDESWFAQLRAMFLQTQFTPGRRDGLAVAARLDLDISKEIGTRLEEPAPARDER